MSNTPFQVYWINKFIEHEQKVLEQRTSHHWNFLKFFKLFEFFCRVVHAESFRKTHIAALEFFKIFQVWIGESASRLKLGNVFPPSFSPS
jgi:hypothetical protein